MGIYLTCHVCTLMIWVKSGTKVILSFKVTVKFGIFFFFWREKIRNVLHSLYSYWHFSNLHHFIFISRAIYVFLSFTLFYPCFSLKVKINITFVAMHLNLNNGQKLWQFLAKDERRHSFQHDETRSFCLNALVLLSYSIW